MHSKPRRVLVCGAYRTHQDVRISAQKTVFKKLYSTQNERLVSESEVCCLRYLRHLQVTTVITSRFQICRPCALIRCRILPPGDSTSAGGRVLWVRMRFGHVHMLS